VALRVGAPLGLSELTGLGGEARGVELKRELVEFGV